ncbi:MAG: 50S ribosomal protein L29 [Candidatus Poribacteria bacterium]
MRISEMRQLSLEELKAKVVDSKDSLFRLKFQRNSGQLQDYKKISQTRREIARLMTIIRERELGIKRGNSQTKTS